MKKSNSNDSSFASYLPIIVTLLAGIFALFQVKSNIISSARIEWTQNLRKNIGHFLSEIVILDYNLKKVIILKEKGELKESEELFEMMLANFKTVSQYGNQIKLFLNNPNEKENLELVNMVDEYIAKCYGKNQDLTVLHKNIIIKSQAILKKSWEEAKTTRFRYLLKLRY